MPPKPPQKRRFDIRWLVIVLCFFCLGVSVSNFTGSFQSFKRRGALLKESFQESFHSLSNTSPPTVGIAPLHSPQKYPGAISTADTYVKLLEQWVSLDQDPDGTNLTGLWRGPSLFVYDDQTKIPAQARRHCKSLFLAASALTGDGVVVEFGPWIGHSSRCLGAGLNTTGLEQRLYSYDSFNDPINRNKLKGTKYFDNPRSAREFRFIWEETARAVYPSAKAIEGRIERVFNAREWLLPLVEVFVIDTAKTHEHLLATGPLVWKYLAVGSIICFMDFVKTPQVELVYSQFVPDGSLELAYLDFCASPWVFVVRKPLPWVRVLQYDPQHYTQDQWESWFKVIHEDVDRIASKFRVADAESVECVKGHVQRRHDQVLKSLTGSKSWRIGG
mmetsp:Transcript_34412/g.75259  ORF Transcript_34412/g.75259 Transcript_34412/m.75259 type:complete len:388 (-) Transcript_34412:137-1300(-)